ncbi:helix-turn-helix domain-containing protein [Robiginitalea aurantiaca]|uniref:AraC family transcriptional regulator n=1 Tax=Robiginitalea aurantiaca TaxID=3056915 RepID=A0ABT7WIC7_9FLAO|nr:AraC family transcriptional regulator [Robiginitalea aurantiaca]MDM9632687.1 AraC family transcriptional regulator [Robiginitalea aurantiaca]
MVLNSLADVLSILTSFLSLFFAFFLLSLKSQNRSSNVLISIYLIISAIDAGSILMGQFIMPYYPGVVLFLNTLLFFSPPLLYFYICSVTYADFKLKWKHLWHALPFVIAIAILIPRFYLADFDGKIEILRADEGLIIEMKLVYLLIHLQIAAYIIASFNVILRSKKLLLENYSNGHVNYYNWLLTLLTLISVEVFVSTLKNVFLINNLDAPYELAMTITGLSALLFICWLVIKALKTPELYGRVDSKQLLVKQLIAGKPQKATLAVEDKGDDELVGRLKRHMETEAPYLDASLSIYGLSKQLDLPSKELSVLINHNLNQHFFDFVNEYRIKKAMEILADTSKSNLTILEILYDVGFNSKSSFNTAFKKYTKLTPTQYRKQYRS